MSANHQDQSASKQHAEEQLQVAARHIPTLIAWFMQEKADAEQAANTYDDGWQSIDHARVAKINTTIRALREAHTEILGTYTMGVDLNA